MSLRRNFLVSPVVIALCAGAFSQPLPVANQPEDVGFSTERLARIDRKFGAEVEQRKLPGAVLLIARKGKIAYFKATGYQDRGANAPLKTDAIYRIASMTKPIVSVAAMALAEEGSIDLEAPISQYLPEFKDVQVGVEKAGNPGLSLEAPKRPVTVQDLLRHTSGLTYGLFGNSAVDKMYLSSGIFAAPTLAEMVKRIAKLPLAHQPGEVWEYSVSVDVLGRVLEVVTGKELDQIVAERITTPLRMSDTAFYLRDVQAGRLARTDTGKQAMMSNDVTRKPPVLSGGGGLLSTVGDYARFCQMMLNKGSLDGTRILSRKTVALMTSDSLPPRTPRAPVAYLLGATGPTEEMGESFGLGFAVRTAAGRNALPGSVGDFHWAGINGTYFWVDPKEDMLAVFMTQVPREQTIPYWRLTRELVYQALMD
jgi:CubicO group peptidase (beta-lactamase class C family)